MRHDLEIPERHGIRQSVGDTVGPGGVMRALRNIPVFLDIARDMEELCPDAWMLNLTNPMTTICRAVTRETSLKTVGLCHEITITQFLLSLLLDVELPGPRPRRRRREPPARSSPRCDVAGDDGFARCCAELLDDADDRGATSRCRCDLPDGLGLEKLSRRRRVDQGRPA